MKKTVYYLIILIIVTTSCNEFLDINEDPIRPTSATYDQLLTNAQLYIANSFGLGENGLSSHISVYMHQLVQRNSADQYGTTGNDNVVIQSWNQLYAGALTDLQYIIDNGLQSGDMIYVGIAKILKAYTYSQMVDVWGDIPYSEAVKMPEKQYPAFDNGKDIYPKLIEMLDEGIVFLSDSTQYADTFRPSTDDLIYNGNTDKWVRIANTIKLKLYNQIRHVQNVDNEINALLEEFYFIESDDDDFELPYDTTSLPENRNPGYIAEYNDASMKYYISPWFYEIMTGQSSNPLLSGIADPKVKYYWFNQVRAYTDADNEVEYGDDGFVSIYFGSISVKRDFFQGNTASVLGLYPVGGRYNDGTPMTVTTSSGKGNVPFRMLTYTSFQFILAELALDGYKSGSDLGFLIQAILSSNNKINQIITNYSEELKYYQIGAENSTHMNAVRSKYSAADKEGKLELLMTHKWIASFGNAIDAWTDYRRTGYPQLFDPNTMASDPPPEDLGEVPTQSGRDFPLSMPWPSPELERNPYAPAQKTPSSYKVFWDKD